GLGKGLLTDAGADEAPEVVVMPGHAEFPGFSGRAEGFFVEQAGFFPEGAFGGKDPDGKGRGGIEHGEVLGDIGQDGFFLVWPIVGTGAEFDFYDGPDVASRAGWEDRRVMEEEALAVGHVGIDFELP